MSNVVVIAFTHEEAEAVLTPMLDASTIADHMGLDVPQEYRNALHKMMLAHALVCPSATIAEQRQIQRAIAEVNPTAFHAVSVPVSL